MKTITLSVDEETYRLAGIRATELDTSVTALLNEYLRNLTGNGSSVQGNAPPPERDGEVHSAAGVESGESEVQRRRRKLRKIFADFDARGVGISIADSLTREELYDQAINGPNALR